MKMRLMSVSSLFSALHILWIQIQSKRTCVVYLTSGKYQWIIIDLVGYWVTTFYHLFYNPYPKSTSRTGFAASTATVHLIFEQVNLHESFPLIRLFFTFVWD